MTHRYTIGVTGALGLVGSGIVRAALSAGHKVIALDRLPPGTHSTTGEITAEDRQLVDEAIQSARSKGGEGVYRYRQVDLLDFKTYKEAVREEGCDALVHLAAVFCRHDDEGNLQPGPTQSVSPSLGFALRSRAPGSFGNSVRDSQRKAELTQQDVHNANVAMSYNTLCIAAELGIDRVVLASSVNSIGMVFSKRPRFDYLPLDEKHNFYPEDAYSLSKYICEIQADAHARTYPNTRIATLRFHWVVPTPLCNPASLHEKGGSWKDLWGFVTVSAAGEAILSAITTPLERFPAGHETFFIVARTICGQKSSEELTRSKFPEIKEYRFGRGTDAFGELKGNVALIDTRKAERLLGWKDVGFPWSG